jgi:hypothetical protein
MRIFRPHQIKKNFELVTMILHLPSWNRILSFTMWDDNDRREIEFWASQREMTLSVVKSNSELHSVRWHWPSWNRILSITTWDDTDRREIEFWASQREMTLTVVKSNSELHNMRWHWPSWKQILRTTKNCFFFSFPLRKFRKFTVFVN